MVILVIQYFAGPVVNHKYLTAGKKTVHITAKNKVHKLEENITVFVNHEIQGRFTSPLKTRFTDLRKIFLSLLTMKYKVGSHHC